MENGKYNLRNPAVKRILQEMKELRKDPSDEFMAAALEDNIFEWHFAVRGPPDTEFQGGIYHGRILLPPEYPFKPPSFLMLSPTGRFETNVKICLSISSHHPEHWQPSWSVRTALTALIAFFPTPGNGAIGSLDYTKEERAALAVKSRVQPPAFGGPERQRVTDDIHQAMLAAEPAQVKEQQVSTSEALSPASEQVLPAEAVQGQSDLSAQKDESPAAGTQPAAAAQAEATLSTSQEPPLVAAARSPEASAQAAAEHVHAHFPVQSQQPLRPAAAAEAQFLREQPQQHNSLLGEAVGAIAADPPAGIPQSWEDRGLTLLAGALVVLIAAVLFRRILVIAGADVTSLM